MEKKIQMQFKSHQQTNSLKTYSLFNFRIIYFILCSVLGTIYVCA